MPGQVGQSSEFRPELQGLRALAALLVMVYHIWLDRISGGVDVFLVVSGYLIIGSLAGRLRQTGQFQPGGYLLRLGRRLWPQAMLVLAVTAALSWWLLPQIRWQETLGHVVASALYYQNWQLAFEAVDYLAQDNQASPLQHYWALSMQGQFYLLAGILALMVSLIGRYSPLRISLWGMRLGIVMLALLSFGWSLYATAESQPFAYFNTFARFWEFCLGGLLALISFNGLVRESLRRLLLWVGLLMVLMTGVLIPVADAFPGYAALMPVAGAGVLIGLARAGGPSLVERFLASRAMVWLGDRSYGLYLWHWPLLIFALLTLDVAQLSLWQGALLMLLSLLLASLSTAGFERPVLSLLSRRGAVGASLMLLALLLLPGISAGPWWQEWRSLRTEQARLGVDSLIYPGAMALHPDYRFQLTAAPVLPSPLTVREDLPKVYEQRCHQMPREEEVLACRFPASPSHATIAVVGGSHSAHWVPAIRVAAERAGWTVVSYTKSACRFTGVFNRGHRSCKYWNEALVEKLIDSRPDLVFTTATLGTGDSEYVPDGFIKQWRKLEREGLAVMAVRDTPRPGKDVADCVAQNGHNNGRCDVPRAAILADSAAFELRDDLPSNVHFVDFSDWFCSADICPAVMGNVLIYRDSHHISATYSQSLAGPVAEAISQVLVSQSLQSPRGGGEG